MKTQTKMLQGILVDPFKQEISRIEISSDPDVWRAVLRCRMLEVIPISTAGNVAMDLWIDEEGMLKDVPDPRFRVNLGHSVSKNGDHVDIAGYGLILSSDKEGNTVSLRGTPLSMDLFAGLSQLMFEQLEGNPRFAGSDASMLYLDEKLRTIELELPGRFRTLDDTEKTD